MDNKKLIQTLGFVPKENSSGIFQKKYSKADYYVVEIDFEKENINYGNKIKGESKTTQNFLQAENWVVLECVDRLLGKGYQPQNITLEKTWKTGHGTSGRLDILVTKDDGSAYLMIECKTWGTEYEKELKNLEKNGGQLFTYFQQDKNADVLMLYTSKIDSKGVEYKNTIVKIEEDYKQTGNVKDFYERWNKLPKTNGIFDSWVRPYEFQSKALTRRDLKALKQKDSSFIFNRILEILRHNVVSDKPNAFNKIFTLFLCKIIDEDRSEDEQLHFQWLEGEDDHISFQKRLTDLYRRGMKELLEKKVTDVSDDEFDTRFKQTVDEQYREEIKNILTEIRLKKNNEFAIKEVYDDASFEDNAKVVKEVVELLQVYQIRYNYRQQFLSDFFELLLTTGLKQESGQFFTPVPIARYIIKSLPIREITLQKIEQGSKNDLLPNVIDYAAGSGHFVTEVMEVIQEYIDTLTENQFSTPTTKKALRSWQGDQFNWAEQYVYAIEKDYRLVKTAKVSCYLHGDGLAKVIHGDGLGDFATSNDFKDLLKDTDKTYPQDNKQFDIVISNPPYSVSAFRGTMMDEEKALKAFELYSRLTDQSSEIECLFVERTKQLLKDGGVAGIILPSSILNNTGIYTQTREIVLKYFDILAITEFGSNTFMATGTNTVTLFLRRRNNADAFNIEEAVKRFFTNLNDVTINGIEKPVHKYVSYVWEGVNFDDYITLLRKNPNEVVKKHEIFKEYNSKIKAKSDIEKWNAILDLEQEKLLYFILTYPQKLVLVKTGEKAEEKRFLGYEFSNRRGSEGIHPIQRGKFIDECTQLFDADTFDNPEKASTYIYKAFQGEFDLDIPEILQKNVSYQNLVDMLSFDRVTFEKNISLTTKKKVNYELIWKSDSLILLSKIADIRKGTSITKAKTVEGNIPVVAGGQEPAYFHNEANRDGNIITVSASGAYSGFVNYFKNPIFASDCNTINSKNENVISTKLIFEFLKSIQKTIYSLQRGQAQPHVYAEDLAQIKIPLPSLNIQHKIVSEIEVLEKKEEKTRKEIENFSHKITELYETALSKAKTILRLNDDTIFEVSIGKRVLKNEFVPNGKIPVYSANVIEPFGNINKLLIEDFSKPSVLWGIDGDWMVSYVPEGYPFYPTDHCGVLRVKNNLVNEKYLAFVLEKEGKAFGFSRTKRASIDRIKGIKISVPTLSEQEKIVSEIEKIETQIEALENEIVEIPKQKEAILKKWLN